MKKRARAPFAIALLAATTVSASGALAAGTKALVDQERASGDIPARWVDPEAGFDYVQREVMVRMRDGVKLHTVIVVPKGAAGLPVLLERTPYDATTFMTAGVPRLRDAIWTAGREWVDAGYIFVYQDVRGKYGSEGTYVMTRPAKGPLNATSTDETTDAYDTVEWLVKHLPESNGRVGMIGSSYDGWTTAMALKDPHPALKVAAPESPMVDGWMGDDWFHYGAFRQKMFDYFTEQTSHRGGGRPVPRAALDDYQAFLDAGSAGAYAASHGLEQLPWWTRLASHPAYDAFWQAQAIDKQLAAAPSGVPTLWLQGFFDQEDIYGAVHAWQAMSGTPSAHLNHLVIGPWSHSQVNGRAEALGPLKWRDDTAATFRKDVLVPFFNAYLKDRAPPATLPPVLVFDAAERRWEAPAAWPATDAPTPFYLGEGGTLSRGTVPAPSQAHYVSDPAKPVPFEPLPVRMGDHASWSTWLVADQRFVSTRTDVLSYRTEPLQAPLKLQGFPAADLFASTTGTDADFVVKIIDVYPDTYAEQPEMGGYQLPISIDIFRGRYRTSFAVPSAITPNRVEEFRFTLPPVNYTVKPGHRLMVQIQSTLFPLYDRNPQTFVPNPFFAEPSDYRAATVTLYHGAQGPSGVLLPVVHSSNDSGQWLLLP